MDQTSIPAYGNTPSQLMSSHRSDASAHPPSPSGRPHRRLSLTLSPHLRPVIEAPHSQAIPVPHRQGSVSNRSPRSTGPVEPLSASPSLRRKSRGSFGSLSGSLFLGPALSSTSLFGGLDQREEESSDEEAILLDSGDWLDVNAGELLQVVDTEQPRIVKGGMRIEQAVKILLDSEDRFVVVDNEDGGLAFFDYADLNTFLLLVLATSRKTNAYDAPVDPSEVTSLAEKRSEAIRRMSGGHPVSVGLMSNISGKNPFHAIRLTDPLRSFLVLFSMGVHRLAVLTPASGIQVLSHMTVLQYLLSLPSDRIPSAFNVALDRKALGISLHPLVSLPETASVLDAMQVMYNYGLRALGVLTFAGGTQRSSTPGSDTSSSSMPSPVLLATDEASAGHLTNIIRARDCAAFVVPSEGKEVLSMRLHDMVKLVELDERGGKERGEERMPVHVLPSSTTLLYACHTILATTSSRIFVRNGNASSPSLSPAHNATSSLRGLPPAAPTLLSPNRVLSVVDVFACLKKLYLSDFNPYPSGDALSSGS